MTPVRAGLLVLLVTAGCQKPAPIAPAQVRGTVTFQGRPLAGGLIVFTPERGEKPFAARLDKGGRYELEPAPPPAPNLPPGVSQGVPPGFYQVSFSDGLYREDGFPSELRRPDTSLTTCEVLAGQENVLPFHITATGGEIIFAGGYESPRLNSLPLDPHAPAMPARARCHPRPRWRRLAG